MRKVLVFSLFLATVFGNGDVCGATARSSRSVASALDATTKSAVTSTKDAPVSQSAAVAARSANRNRITKQNVTTNTSTAKEPIAARSATRGTARVATQKTSSSTPSRADSAVRSATKQKAINIGTKVKSATENSGVPQECQDAFYGCMDTFCMMENTSGGRCRCDDRGEELDLVFEQLQAFDAQTTAVAEQTVERLQSGNSFDEINAMAEKTSSQVLSDYQKEQQDLLKSIENKKKTNRDLDLSSLTGNWFDTDDMFDEDIDIVDTSNLSSKTGNALLKESVRVCAAYIPEQCKVHSRLIQMAYANQIKSDCIGYENYLKKMRLESQSLLNKANRAVRDVAAQEYEKANKYDLGGCTLRFKQCMVGEDACGPNYSNCVINKMAVLGNSTKTKKIKTSAATIEIDATTFGQVEAMKARCEYVLEQCVNNRDKVWDEFLKVAAPELKMAEYAAEDEQRGNCVKNVVSCIKNKASEEGHTEGSDNWAFFTMNLDNVKSVCSGALRQCGAYDTDMVNNIMQYVKLSLNAIRADKCTTSIKKCLESDTVCFKDYSNCVGVGTDFMWAGCGDIVTADCVGREDIITEDNLKRYISDVASGVLQNMDNKIAERCRKAAESAMITQCGSTSGCSDVEIAPEDVESAFIYKVCPADNKKIDSNCYDSAATLTEDDMKDAKKWRVWVYNTLRSGGAGTGSVLIKNASGTFSFTGSEYKDVGNKIANILNSKVNATMNNINSEEIKNCKNGSSARGFDNEILSTGTVTKFPNLIDNYKQIIASSVYTAFVTALNSAASSFEEKQKTDTSDLAEMYEEAQKPEPEPEETTEEAEDEEVVDLGNCEMGNCNACSTADRKCECIASTYFQYEQMSHQGADKAGEYAVVRNVSYSGGICSFEYTHVHGCKKCKIGEGTADKKNTVQFQLYDDTPISISKCTASDSPWDRNRGFMDELRIGSTSIKFVHCSMSSTPLTYWNGARQPYRGQGACYWCDLEDVQKHPSSNNPTVSKGRAGGFKNEPYIEFP